MMLYLWFEIFLDIKFFPWKHVTIGIHYNQRNFKLKAVAFVLPEGRSTSIQYVILVVEIHGCRCLFVLYTASRLVV